MATDERTAPRESVEAPVYPDPSSGDPRERGLDDAGEIDPGSGQSDDPRVHPGGNDGNAANRGSTDDRAWQNQFTEETIPSPEAREDAAHDTKLDPM